jgi:hypothetical protein
MDDQEYIKALIEIVEELQGRVLNACSVVERRCGEESLEETAELRNLVMRLDGLKLRLRKSHLH